MPRLRQARVPVEEEEVLTKEPEVEVQTEEPPKLEVVAEPEPEPEPPPPPPQEDREALKRQLEAQVRAELQQQHNEQMRQAQSKYEAEMSQYRQQAMQHEVVAIDKAIEAARAEAEKAVLDYEQADSIGDSKAKAEANRRIARAEAALGRWEDEKGALEARQKEAPPPQQQPQNKLPELPTAAQQWIEANPQHVHGPGKVEKLNAIHDYLVRVKGYQPFSPTYFQALEYELGPQPPKEEPKVEAKREEKPAPAPVSAPVSRQAIGPNGSKPQGKITLNASQLEAAKIAGVTPEEYAKQMLKLQQMRADGTYGDKQ